MLTNIKELNKLINELSKLPGLGYKSSIRLAQFLIENDKNIVNSLLNNISVAKDKIKKCTICSAYTDNENICSICNDVYRDKNIICVLEKPFDVFIFERSGYKGLYHVLNGLLNPMEGVGEDKINISSLVNRVKEENVKEIIIALNQSVEGDATTLLIAHELISLNVKITRLARGVPAGANIDVLDETTLSCAVEGRLCL